MKIFFLSLLISFNIINFSNAQSFTFVESNVQYLIPTCGGYNDYYVHMRNEKVDSLRMQWKAIENPMDSCWLYQYSMCDNYTCYQGIPSTPMTMTTVGPGDTTDLKFSSNAFTHFSGTPVVKVLVWDMDIPTSVDTITYYITICPDSVACEYYSMGTNFLINKNEVKVYPVPANDKINLIYPVLRIGRISITDLSGKEIISIPANGNSAFVNIEWMTKGIYFIRISENNKIEFTQKFIKL